MKKLPLIIIGLSILFVGCKKDFLNNQPQSQGAAENYWKTQTDAVQAVNNCYRFIRKIDEDIFLSCATDDSYAWSNWPVDITSVGNGSATSTTGVFNDYWSNDYRGIAQTNFVLDNIDKVPDIDKTLGTRLKAEARFIRAYLYQELTGLYGDVPLITHIQSPSEFDVPRTPKDSVSAFVVNELSSITNDLPLSYSGSDRGRVTKGAALALKARTLLYEGKWQEAAAAAKSVMDLNQYQIDQSGYLSLFDGTNKYSNEIILSGGYVKSVAASGLATCIGGPSLGGWSEVTPLQSLVDAYECTDGKTIDQSPLYDPNHPFNNRDPRLTLTIVVPGSVVNGKTIDVSNPSSPDALGKNNASFTGYYYKKYIPADISGDWYNNSYNDEVLIRYAEVLLTYAEAKTEAGEIDQSVYDAINQVRQRAGVNMPAVTAADYGTQSALRTLIRRERRVEFALEPQRLFDIRRWKIADQVMTGKAYGILNNFDPSRGDFGQHVLVETRQFNAGKDYLWPIPQNEKDLNHQLTQNPGW